MYSISKRKVKIGISKENGKERYKQEKCKEKEKLKREGKQEKEFNLREP
jgi:hypothetical protein